MMTSLPSSLCGWSNLLITGALIRLLLSWKASAILNHYNLSTFSLSSITEQWQQDLACENNKLILFYTARLGAGNGPCCQTHHNMSMSSLPTPPPTRSPGFYIKSVIPQFAVTFSGFSACLSACQKDFMKYCCTHILLLFVPSVPLASRWLPTAASPPTPSNWIPYPSMVRASFKRK